MRRPLFQGRQVETFRKGEYDYDSVPDRCSAVCVEPRVPMGQVFGECGASGGIVEYKSIENALTLAAQQSKTTPKQVGASLNVMPCTSNALIDNAKRKQNASRRSWLLGLVVLAGAGVLGVADEAKAEFRVCNATQNLVGVAIGYRAKEGWIAEGWWQIPAATCATLIEGQLQSRYYYLYAEDAARGGRWTGDVNMCVAENEFKITGVQDCYARGFQQFGFKEYDTGRQGSWMVQLTDTPASQESQN